MSNVRRRMHIRGVGGELALTLLHRTPAQSPAEPDLHIQCWAKTPLFTVESSSAWLEWPDVQAFVSELEALNRALIGKAELYAMSPADFSLTVTNLDSKGHLRVSFTIASHNYTENGQFESSVRGSFEVLPSELESILAWFKYVIASEGAA
jgi:hypothetical protein